MTVSRASLRLTLAAAAVACAIAAVPAPASAATNPCRAESMRSGSTILLATSQAVVFRSKRFKTEVACSYKHKRIVAIGGFVCCQLPRYALAGGGRYMGYVKRLDEAFNEVDELGVVDLKTGKQLRYKNTSFATTVDTEGFVLAFYVTPHGSLAWLQEYAENEAHTEGDMAVRSIVPGAETQDLDTGKTIDDDSLALAPGGRLYWVNQGAVKSATLP